MPTLVQEKHLKRRRGGGGKKTTEDTTKEKGLSSSVLLCSIRTAAIRHDGKSQVSTKNLEELLVK